MKLKTLNLTVLLITILVLIPTIQIVYADTIGTFYLSGGIYPSAPYYTIWVESTTYFAKNAYGFIPSWGSSTNASNLIQLCHDDLPSTGGSIYLKQGAYLFSGYVTFSKALVLYGDGRATEIKLADGASLPYFIKISPSNNIQIKNMLMWASTSTDMSAIHFNNNAGIIWYASIDNVMTINIDAITSDSDADASTELLQFPSFSNMIIEDPYEYGLQLHATIDGEINRIIVFSSTQKHSTYGLYLHAKLTSGYIINELSVFRQGYGMYLNYSSDTKITNSFLDLCNNTYALKIENSSCVMVHNTYFHAPNGYGLQIDGASNLTICSQLTAKACDTGIYDSSSPDGTQYFASCIATESTTDWDIDANDVVRGCVGKADQN